MYLGIDLGTSNSAIVGNIDGTSRLFKTSEGADVLPSAILIDRRGGMMVGRRAYDQSAFAPESVAQGFKRLMGTASRIQFAGIEKTLSPEDASSEIIKALVSQARMSAGELEVDGAVITIPAAFNQMQIEATMRAAVSAGLERVALLQEPIAAAMASISKASKKSGQFLVYDLGGGTFDVAIVQSIAGEATVMSHAGINMLGGRDFDKAITRQVVFPWLKANFDLPEEFYSIPKYNRLVRMAEYRSESAKISLSTQLVDRIFADENQVATKDEGGNEIYLDVEFHRREFEEMIEEDIDNTIAFCKKTIEESGYGPGSLDRIVLIGGPSRIPFVRSRLATALNIPVDLETDPMTAVAHGAAIFAEGRQWIEGAARPTKHTQTSAKSGGDVELRYEYLTKTAAEKVRIKVRLIGTVGRIGIRILLETDSGWSSGLLEISDQIEVRDVPLTHYGENRIRVSVFDADGPSQGSSQELVVTKLQASAHGTPLTHSLGIKIATGAIGAERNILLSFISKGTTVPRSGVERLRAARDIRAGDGTSLDFELYQHEEGVLDPELSLPIGVFQLQSSKLDRGETIRRGDSVSVHWSVDANGLLNCSIEFEQIQQIYETGKMYVSTVGHIDFDSDEGLRHATTAIEKARGDVFLLEQTLGLAVTDNVVRLRKRLDTREAQLRSTTDADTRRSVAEDARMVRQDVALILARPEFVKVVLVSNIDRFLDFTANAGNEAFDDTARSKINRLARLARDSVNRGDSGAVKDAERSLDEARELAFEELIKRPQFWVGMFEDIAEDRAHAIDKKKHDEFVAKGEKAINDGDVEQLRSVVGNLRGNMVNTGDVGKTNVISGLMGY